GHRRGGLRLHDGRPPHARVGAVRHLARHRPGAVLRLRLSAQPAARHGNDPGELNNRLWVAAAVCLGVSLTPWGPLVLYPFTLFTTWVHECSHALMVVLLGGHVSSITIQPDTSGLTRSLVPASRLVQGA